MLGKMKGLSVFGLLALALGVQGCARSAPQATALPTPATAPKSAGAPATKNCDALALTEKEACYAAYDEAALAECERVRLYSCAPYAHVYRLEAELEQLNADMMRAARETYASYEDTQPGYVKEVEESFVASDSAWRAYRDAHCAQEPFIQGMSRSEVAGLTESCRARKTEERVKELKELMSGLFMEEATNEQRRE